MDKNDSKIFIIIIVSKIQLDSMKSIIYLFPFLFLFSSCDDTTSIFDSKPGFHLLPQPKSITTTGKALKLSDKSRLYTSNAELVPLINLLQSEIYNITEINIDIGVQPDQSADVVFELDDTLDESEYYIDIEDEIQVSGGSYQALSMAKTTLLQLVSTVQNQLAFPCLKIKDYPDASYRGLMVDLARQWHSTATINKIIDLAAFYKINYLQLHFTDYQSYTLPCTSYPKLSTEDRHYSFEELKELESYSQLRGVTIIPEIDIPGHSSPFVKKYPETFAIKDSLENPWIINMGKEEVYEALDDIIGEIAAIFKATPYFHIGGDEAIFHKVNEDPHAQGYMKDYELGADVHELYRHFLVRINDIVKGHNKQMCAWEGFRPDGKVEIPKDIIVFEFETNRYLPNLLVDDGYTVVNTSWKPLYVVNKKKWEPRTIYEWNLWRWENWFPKAPSFTPIQVERSPLIIGAQMCAWEQPDNAEFPGLRKRLPALSERIWNVDEVISYDLFMNRLDTIDSKLTSLVKDSRQDTLLLGYNFVE